MNVNGFYLESKKGYICSRDHRHHILWARLRTAPCPSCIPGTLRQAPRISLKCPGGDTESCHRTWPVPALACPLEGTLRKMENINLFSAWNQSQNLGRQSTRDSIATCDIVTAASHSWKTTQERRGERHLSKEQINLQSKHHWFGLAKLPRSFAGTRNVQEDLKNWKEKRKELMVSYRLIKTMWNLLSQANNATGLPSVAAVSEPIREPAAPVGASSWEQAESCCVAGHRPPSSGKFPSHLLLCWFPKPRCLAYW